MNETLTPKRAEEAGRVAGHVAYAGLQVARHAGNLVRRRQSPPDYVTLTLGGDYPELPPVRKTWQRFLPAPESMRDVAAQMRTVAADPRVHGVVLHLRPLDVPQSGLETLRDLIGEMRAEGKHVVAWSSRYTTGSYYLACAADEILLQPGGEVWPLGLQRSFLFLADALEQVGMAFDGVQITPYKTALDTFTRTEMSDEAREQANWLIDAGYREILRGVAEGRGVDEAGAEAIVDGAPYTDLGAVDAGVVDALVSEEDLPGHLGDADRPASLEPWATARKHLLIRAPVRPGKYVALLRIEGNIVDGESARPPAGPPSPLPLVADPRAGDLTVVRDARQVMEDDRAAAVVVYIDSRGGSATASEAMAAALAKVAHRKPVVAAMGAFAASGGYYVATPAGWIVAQPDTITGSIGVLSGKLVNAGLLDRMHVNREHVRRGQNVDLYGTEQPFSDDQRAVMWEGIRRIYDVFVDRVASSRKMSTDDVDAIGGGRVWTGRQAHERGLVDQLGGIDAALDKARHLAGLNPRAPVREIASGKVPLAPVADPTALIRYGVETVRLLNQARTWYLLPVDWREE